MYTLNYLFNFGAIDGRFDGDRGGVLGKSKNWLRLKKNVEAEPANPDPSVFNPERATIWKDLGEAGTLLLTGGSSNIGNICIRLQPSPEDSSTAPPTPDLPAGATLQLVVTFGRPVRANQVQASPFTDSGAVKTTFTFGPITRNSTTVGGATPVAWFFPLGKVTGPTSTEPDLTDRYEFSVGVKVTSAGITHYYGDDPEMDIGQ
jgi:hypothetical protein